MMTQSLKLPVRAEARNWRPAVFIPTVLGGLLLALYFPILKLLVADWWTDPNVSFCALVPLLSGFALWRVRERLRRTPLEPSNWGLAWLMLGIALLVGGSLGAELFTSRISLLVAITGMVLFLAGRPLLRVVRFPLAFLVFMVPLPALIYNQITFPLQLLSSRFAVFWLQFLGVPVFREGNILYLPHYALEVVEACSGIRSLMALLALAVAYVYFAERRWWMRTALVLFAVPAAVVSNGVRVVGTGLLTFRFGPGAAEGFFHEFQGAVVFLCALVLLFVAHGLLKTAARYSCSLARRYSQAR